MVQIGVDMVQIGVPMRARGPFALLALAALGCGSPVSAVPGTSASYQFARPVSLYDAPFPSAELAASGYGISLFPNPNGIDLITKSMALLQASADGFGTSSGVFFRFDGAIDATRLPTVEQSRDPSATVFLLGIDPASPDYLKAIPTQSGFSAAASPFGDANLLTVLPYQGTPMRPKTAYAAVVRRSLHDASGKELGAQLALEQLLHGQQPAGLSAAGYAEYKNAVAALNALQFDLSDVAALTAFTTGDPLSVLSSVRDAALAQPKPLPSAAMTLMEQQPDYCVYQGTVQMPDYQSGTPPFANSPDGRWLFDASGAPILQRSETANLFVTIPRQAQPANGWPVVLYIRAGGSGEVPMVNRGPQTVTNGPQAPGEGPAMHFAQVGWAGVEVDGPLGGLRNPNGEDEEYLIFNFLNPDALRDNIRESAMELSLMARALPQLTLDATGCDAATPGTQKLDTAHLALWGHSTGATIAPIAASIEPSIRALILSGAGGSYLNNVLYKKLPLDVLPLAETLLDYPSDQTLDFRDPVVSLIQWAGEPADNQVYARQILREPLPGAQPRHVLMFQGIVDHYILPPMANALSLTLGVDVGDPVLDSGAAELASMPHILDVLDLSGRQELQFPVSLNVATQSSSQPAVTAVLSQHPGDGIDDGHEVVFQTEPPKHQYRCYLQSWAQTGTPRVPAWTQATLATDPCQ